MADTRPLPLTACLMAGCLALAAAPLQATSLRIATYNASMNSFAPLQLYNDIADPNIFGYGPLHAKNIAEIIQRVDPDILLINEFDYDSGGLLLERFQDLYLGVGQNGAAPVTYAHTFIAPSNTGVDSGHDYNNNGTLGEADDAYGYGLYPGQFAMAVLSKYPIQTANARTFQQFLWKDMPGALRPAYPQDPTEDWWYNDTEWADFRLSSKSHWDLPIDVNGQTVHVLASHPTPPVFDGAEDRNGLRNHDEIRFWADYITPGSGGYIYDDNSVTGQLPGSERFVILGDQNADPDEGDSYNNAIDQLLQSPHIDTGLTPTSLGADEHNGGVGDPDDTATFELRADYVLGSYSLRPDGAGVFWPDSTDPLYPLVSQGLDSDHRLVWMDYKVIAPGDANRDGFVDSADFNLLASNFNSTTATWLQADFNRDQIVDSADFNALASNFNSVLSGGPAIPEPTSLALAAAGSVALLRRRR